MQTYTGGTQNNKQGKENVEEIKQGEDLFISGGFDSFGGAPEPINTDMGQMNAGMGQLGSVGYGSGNAYRTVDNSTMSTNRWSEPRIILNLWGQLFNSFMPFRYDRYKGMSMNAAKDFVKFFVKLYIITGYLFAFFVMLLSPGTKEFLMSGNMGILVIVIILGVCYFIGTFLGPYFFRLQAFIYRVIFGNLLMAIEKKNINSTNMYLVSIYACVPCYVIGVLISGIVVLAAYLNVLPLLMAPIASVASSFSVIELILPIIIMALAIPRME